MDRKAERLRLIRLTACWAAVLGGYYIFSSLTGLRIPCLFYEITGLKCPGCGITHMCVHLAHLEFREAFLCNPLLFFMVPLLLIMLAVKIIFLPRWLDGHSPLLNGILAVFIGLLIVFCVVRNIIGI